MVFGLVPVRHQLGWLIAAAGVAVMLPANAEVHKAHAITLYDEAPKYPADFSHFDYVNPNAPKGGIFRGCTRSRVEF